MSLPESMHALLAEIFGDDIKDVFAASNRTMADLRARKPETSEDKFDLLIDAMNAVAHSFSLKALGGIIDEATAKQQFLHRAALLEQYGEGILALILSVQDDMVEFNGVLHKLVASPIDAADKVAHLTDLLKNRHTNDPNCPICTAGGKVQ